MAKISLSISTISQHTHTGHLQAAVIFSCVEKYAWCTILQCWCTSARPTASTSPSCYRKLLSQDRAKGQRGFLQRSYCCLCSLYEALSFMYALLRWSAKNCNGQESTCFLGHIQHTSLFLRRASDP